MTKPCGTSEEHRANLNGAPNWRVIERLSIDEHDYTFNFDSHKEAYLFARRFACSRDALFVRIFSPDGTLAHEWTAETNRWIAHAGHPEL